MKSSTLIILLLSLVFTSCNSFRPVSSVRNPSRAGKTTATAERSRPRPAPREATVPPRRSKPAPARKPAAPAAEEGTTGLIRNSLVSHAEQYLGLRYKYGGNTPGEGFDCSGFVKYLYNDEGISIHRVSRDQARQGKEIDPEEAQPGDLVFFRRGPNQPVFHVSMIVEAGPEELWVIHPTTSRGVIRENILASSYWRPKISAVKTFMR
ncbi:cell wall-associated NlpC family hydrolase [Lewinella marina]|uniref:C40 family peptidase n=1 Tax=Neolewinella marina TaxID=438751 RepID=UPI001431FE03|nr:C40 family peptidase [Neolewinella marina]NJB86634.1 cell wall-associated NlpC family hydrolase [Neolewinella marina]